MTAPLRTWLAEPLPSAVRRSLEQLAAAEEVVAVAVMPDVHLAEEVCVGCVVATRNALLPAAIGGDLGCGMTTQAFAGDGAALVEERVARRLLRQLASAVPGLVQRAPAAELPLPAPLAAWPLSDPTLARRRDRDGRREFATLGRGNHFLELQRDDAGTLWLAVHSGSRALGPAIAAHHRRLATDAHRREAIAADTPAAAAFLGDLDFALAWAQASREALLDRASTLLQEHLGLSTRPETRFSCVHNLVRRETIDGELMWVHRKGAIPAQLGAPGIVPGSMGSATFHVEGRGCAAALHSSSHGAGRALARGEAHRRLRVRDFARTMHGIWWDDARAAALLDEAPAAYKKIGRVMRAQRELTRIVRRLVPVLNWKGAS